jgi:hypothetical protein
VKRCISLFGAFGDLGVHSDGVLPAICNLLLLQWKGVGGEVMVCSGVHVCAG